MATVPITTEKQWLASKSLRAMLHFLKGRISDRKVRLFQVAAAWRRDDGLPEEIHGVLDVIEKYADGELKYHKLEEARRLALRVADEALAGVSREPRRAAEFYAAMNAACHVAQIARLDPWYDAAKFPPSCLPLLRDIAGNPFRTPDLDRDKLARANPDLVLLAEGVYDGRRFEDMFVLGDALEEAGCTDEHVLGHCRSGGPHVRGCWVLDLVLGLG